MITKDKKVVRKQKDARKRMFTLLVMVLFITMGSIVFGSSFSDAHGNSTEEPMMYKYYKSIVIQPGDTLWSIAQEYMTDDYESIQEYIEELKKINSLKSENIQESQHLLVVYYNTEFK